MKNFIKNHVKDIIIIVLVIICLGLLVRLNVTNDKLWQYKVELTELDHVSNWYHLYTTNLINGYNQYVSDNDEDWYDICHDIDEYACIEADNAIGHPYHTRRVR